MPKHIRPVSERHHLCEAMQTWLNLQCYIGNVVVSTNPFRELPIYGPETIAKYRGRSAFDPKLQPHM